MVEPAISKHGGDVQHASMNGNLRRAIEPAEVVVARNVESVKPEEATIQSGPDTEKLAVASGST